MEAEGIPMSLLEEVVESEIPGGADRGRKARQRGWGRLGEGVPVGQGDADQGRVKCFNAGTTGYPDFNDLGN